MQKSLPSQSWKKGFEVAKAASKYAIAPREGLRIGAALYAKSALLSIGFNTYYVTHPASARNKLFDRNIHAEHRAIIKRQHYDNSSMVMYVYRELANGILANCMPCLTCQKLMAEAGVKRVRFINEGGQFEELSLCIASRNS